MPVINRRGDDPHLWNCYDGIEAHLKKCTKPHFMQSQVSLLSSKPIFFCCQVFSSNRHAEVCWSSACWLWKVLCLHQPAKERETIHLKPIDKWHRAIPVSKLDQYPSAELSKGAYEMLVEIWSAPVVALPPWRWQHWIDMYSSMSLSCAGLQQNLCLRNMQCGSSVSEVDGVERKCKGRWKNTKRMPSASSVAISNPCLSIVKANMYGSKSSKKITIQKWAHENLCESFSCNSITENKWGKHIQICRKPWLSWQVDSAAGAPASVQSPKAKCNDDFASSESWSKLFSNHCDHLTKRKVIE